MSTKKKKTKIKSKRQFEPFGESKGFKRSRSSPFSSSSIVLGGEKTRPKKKQKVERHRRRKTDANLNSIKNVKPGGIICNNYAFKPDLKSIAVSKNVKSAEVYFSDIENHVARKIREFCGRKGEEKGKEGKRSGTIVGCMAWFSNRVVLNAISENAKRTLFVVNDEDYSSWKNVISMYEALPKFTEPLHRAFSHVKGCALNALDRDCKGAKKNECSYTRPVRAFGSGILPGSKRECDRGGPSSLMHNKFMIFFESRPSSKFGGRNIDVPCAVITGSFNATGNASNNLENTVFVEDDEIALRYFNEFSIIFFNSRKLRGW